MKPIAICFSIARNEKWAQVYTPAVTEALETQVVLHKEWLHNDNLQNADADTQEVMRKAEIAFCTWGMPVFTLEEIETYFPSLRVIFYGAGSVQSFARPFLQREVKISSAWGANAVPVAQWTTSCILLANKGFFRAVGQKENPRVAGIEAYPGNWNVRVGLLGYGMIPRKVARMLRAMEFEGEIWAYDPFVREETMLENGVCKAEMADIFRSCQTISNHLPNKDEIVGVLNAGLFDSMLDNACFINTGRGMQVVEDDLVRALKSEPGRCAVLDVTWPEPPKTDGELYELKNVFYTPHLAGSTGFEPERHGWYMVEELKRYLSGEGLRYGVSLERLATMA